MNPDQDDDGKVERVAAELAAERVARAEQLADHTKDKATELAAEGVSRAERLAQYAESNAERLAAQRQGDLDRERKREYERGKREALDEAHTAQQDRHLDTINGSMVQHATELGEVKTRLHSLESSFERFTAVQEAIAAKAITTRQFIVGVFAVLIPIVIVLVTSGKTP